MPAENRAYTDIILENISKEYKIEEYLASRGINPVKRYEGKPFYLCPLHQDTKPSFVVFNNRECDIYYCFGCKRTGNILSLITRLEHKSWKVVVESLSKNLTVNDQDQLEYIVNECRKIAETTVVIKIEEIVKKIENMSLQVSLLCYMYLNKCEYDVQEKQFLEKLYRMMDTCVESYDILGMTNIYEFITNAEVKMDNAGTTMLSPFRYRSCLWQKRCAELLEREDRGEDVIKQELLM